MMKEENISDSEIRVIGTQQPPKRPFPWRWVIPVVVAFIALIGGILTWQLSASIGAAMSGDEPGVFEQEQTEPVSHPLQVWIESLDTIATACTATTDLTVNDIPLRIYVPLHSTPHLEIGYGIAKKRESAILFFQAADVRADNGKIVGAFVLKGKPLSWGLSKKGYCSIIDGQVTVGVADNSPLFEQATEHNGYFFRQFPLVDNGRLVENELKNKAIRRAICELENRIVVAETQSMESLHDFAQALVDIGADNAIYLVGGEAMGWSMDADGEGIKMGLWDAQQYKNVSFIVWPK